MIALMLAMGCVQDIPAPPVDSCTSEAPVTGVVVQEIGCRDRLIDGGDGVIVDTWMASPHLRAVVRHPVQSRTLPGVGGGTLVDVAPWGHDDVAYEITPLVGGGWLDVDAMERDPDGVTVRGTVRSLPDRDVPEGDAASVRWSLSPDAPVVTLDGADGLWLHPLSPAVRLGPALVIDGVVVVTDAGAIEDLGGALRMDDVHRIAVAPLGEADWLDHPTVRLVADTDDADVVAVRIHGETVRLPVSASSIDWRVPAAASEVRLEAHGRAASPWRAVDAPSDDPLGTYGQIWVTVPNATTDASVRWEHEDGRHGRALTEAGLVILRTGSGRVTLTVDDGPSTRPVVRTVDVAADATVPVRIGLDTLFDASGHVPIQWLSEGARDRTSRRTDRAHLLDAAHAGSDVTVLAPRDDVADVDIDNVIRVRNGGRLTSPDGWEVAAWPWGAHPRLAGHGAPPVLGRSPEDGLALAAQGPTLGRLTLVNADWLRMANPDLADPVPTGAMLRSVSDVDVWFEWLDAARNVVPAGPITWLPVPDPANVLAVEAERAWVAGDAVASTEGRIDLLVDGLPPGEWVDPFTVHSATVAVHTGGALDTVCIIVDGDELTCRSVTSSTVKRITIPAARRWVVALATGPDDFAVTGPIWVRRTLD